MVPAPVRLAVVGAGDFGRRHLVTARAMAELDVVGVAELDPARREQLGREGHVVAATLEALLTTVDADAVLIATPPAAHLADLHTALGHGLFALVEKPVVTDREGLAALAALDPDEAVRVVPAHVSRFLPDFSALLDAVADHKVRAVRAVRVVPAERLDMHGEEHPALSAMVHDLDLVRALVPARLERVTSEQRWLEPHRPHPQVVLAHLSFADGTVASVENRWTMPHALQYIDARMEVVTDSLTAHLNVPAGGLRLSSGQGDLIPASELEGWVHGIPAGALAHQLRHFAAVVRGARQPAVTLEDALWSVDVALQIAEQRPSR